MFRWKPTKVDFGFLSGFCGFYGNCGAAVGTGIFASLVTNATPLSIADWKLANLVTAKSLYVIAQHGGPRCCKRTTFLALLEAANFVKEHFGVTFKLKKEIKCEFYPLNNVSKAKLSILSMKSSIYAEPTNCL